MRFRLVLILIAFVGALSAQKPIKYSIVIDCPGITAEQAYSNVELWLVNSFDNPNKVIQLSDPASKKLVVKASSTFKSRKRNAGDINGFIDYVLNMFFRDGRMKLEMVSMNHVGRNPNYSFGTLTDLELPDVSLPLAPKKWKADIYQEMKDRAELEWNTIFRLVSVAANNKTAEQDDDW